MQSLGDETTCSRKVESRSSVDCNRLAVSYWSSLLCNGRKSPTISDNNLDTLHKIGICGHVSEQEFLAATIDRNLFIRDDNVKRAFGFFDRDRTGSISIKNLVDIFGSEAHAQEIVGKRAARAYDMTYALWQSSWNAFTADVLAHPMHAQENAAQQWPVEHAPRP